MSSKDLQQPVVSVVLDLPNLRVGKELGRGGFATCWFATYRGQNVALKVLTPRRPAPIDKTTGNVANSGWHAPGEDLYDRMFLREAQVMMQLEHRHIVRCFNVAQLPAAVVPKQPQPALAMMLELCESKTLKDLIMENMASGRRGFKTQQAYVWLHQIASALAYMHRQRPPIIHRDIKADNILLVRDASGGGGCGGGCGRGGGDWICKISDLGLHVALSEHRPVMLRRRSPTSVTTDHLGTRDALAASSRRLEEAPTSPRMAATPPCSPRAQAPPPAPAKPRPPPPPPPPQQQQQQPLASTREPRCGAWEDRVSPQSPFMTVSAATSFTIVTSCGPGGGDGKEVRARFRNNGGRLSLELAGEKQSREGATLAKTRGGSFRYPPKSAHDSRHVHFQLDDGSVGSSSSRRGLQWHPPGTEGASGGQQHPAAVDSTTHRRQGWTPADDPASPPPPPEGAAAAGTTTTPRPATAATRSRSAAAAAASTPATCPPPLGAAPVASGAPQGASQGEAPSGPLRFTHSEDDPVGAGPPGHPVTVGSSAGAGESEASASTTGSAATPDPEERKDVSQQTGSLQHLQHHHQQQPQDQLHHHHEQQPQQPQQPEALSGVDQGRATPTGRSHRKRSSSRSSSSSADRAAGSGRDGGHPPVHVGLEPSVDSTLSGLLSRFPDLVEPVPRDAPEMGLRNVASLLAQLGMSELRPLRRNEMEWVFGLTGRTGSFMYMAPEVFRNEPYNEKSDVFSFGVLAYEVLASELLLISILNTGRGAKLGVYDPQGYAEQVSAGFRPARIQALSDAAWALIESCWHPDPVQRPTMAAVEGQLAELVREMEQTRTSGGSRVNKQQQPAGANLVRSRSECQAAGSGRLTSESFCIVGLGAMSTGGQKRNSSVESGSSPRAAPRVAVGDSPSCVVCAIC